MYPPLGSLLSISPLAGVWVQYSSHTDVALKSVLLDACVTCPSLLTFLGDPLPHQPGLSERQCASQVSRSTHHVGEWGATHLSPILRWEVPIRHLPYPLKVLLQTDLNLSVL